MVASDAFYKKAKDAIRKNEGFSEDLIVNQIHEILSGFLSDLPESLRDDIFNFYYDRYLEKKEEGANLYTLAELPLPLVDFMTCEQPDAEVDFTDEEWDMIREGINATADSMDIRVLNRLMKVLVDRKKY